MVRASAEEAHQRAERDQKNAEQEPTKTRHVVLALQRARQSKSGTIASSVYRMDVWAESAFPANIGLWLLVTTISRKVNQLNFPLRVLETAKGMASEIVLLRDAAGAVRYAVGIGSSRRASA